MFRYKTGIVILPPIARFWVWSNPWINACSQVIIGMAVENNDQLLNREPGCLSAHIHPPPPPDACRHNESFGLSGVELCDDSGGEVSVEICALG